MEGAHLRVVSAYAPPLVTYIEDGCTSRDCFKGIFANVFHTLSDQMNFTYTISRAYMWGSVTDGTWNGMVGMLKDGIVDIAATDLTITNERSAVVDFLPSLMETKEELYMKNPGDAFSTVSYMGAFTKSSWTAIGLWIMMMPLILFGISRKTKNGNHEGIGLLNCYLFVSASLAHLKYNLNLGNSGNRIKNRIHICCYWRFTNLLSLEGNINIKFGIQKNQSSLQQPIGVFSKLGIQIHRW